MASRVTCRYSETKQPAVFRPPAPRRRPCRPPPRDAASDISVGRRTGDERGHTGTYQKTFAWLVLGAALFVLAVAAPLAAAGPELLAAPLSAEFLHYQADSSGWTGSRAFGLA